MSQQKPIKKRREQKRTPDPMEIRFSGPRIAMREADSAHIMSFSQLAVEQGSYYNSIPITTAEIARLVNAALDWLGPEMEHTLLAERGMGPHATA